MRKNAGKKAWILKNPEKYTAHGAVSSRIQRGTLHRQPCERCGATSNVDAHHEDYTQPLAVQWLCRKCHYAVDRDKHGAFIAQQKQQMTPEKLQQGRELRAQGLTYKRIASILGMSEGGVYKALTNKTYH